MPHNRRTRIARHPTAALHRHHPGRKIEANGYVYVTNRADGTLSVIDSATNTVAGSPITVGFQPFGVAVAPNGDIYVANGDAGTVSVLAWS